MALDVEVDRLVCIGSGQCCVYAPDAFEIDDEAKAVFVTSPTTSWEQVRTAVEACPTGALRLVGTETASEEHE